MCAARQQTKHSKMLSNASFKAAVPDFSSSADRRLKGRGGRMAERGQFYTSAGPFTQAEAHHSHKWSFTRANACPLLTQVELHTGTLTGQVWTIAQRLGTPVLKEKLIQHDIEGPLNKYLRNMPEYKSRINDLLYGCGSSAFYLQDFIFCYMLFS